jgi:hypothetical protein
VIGVVTFERTRVDGDADADRASFASQRAETK